MFFHQAWLGPRPGTRYVSMVWRKSGSAILIFFLIWYDSLIMKTYLYRIGQLSKILFVNTSIPAILQQGWEYLLSIYSSLCCFRYATSEVRFIEITEELLCKETIIVSLKHKSKKGRLHKNITIYSTIGGVLV